MAGLDEGRRGTALEPGRARAPLCRSRQLDRVGSGVAGRRLLDLGDARPLFQFHTPANGWRYEPTPDGGRFLVLSPPADEPESFITLITDWPELTTR